MNSNNCNLLYEQQAQGRDANNHLPLAADRYRHRPPRAFLARLPPRVLLS